MLTSPLAPADFALLCEVIAMVSRNSRLPPEDAEDFRQHVHLTLLERQYAPIRRFAGRSSLRTYLTVVVGRQLLDWRNRRYGKWRPCEAARRLGPTAIQLDRLLSRDGYELEEAVARLTSMPGGEGAATVRALAAQLPVRRRTRTIAIEDVDALGVDGFADPIETAQAGARDEVTRVRLQAACRSLSAADRRLLHLRFGRGLKVSVIAPIVGEPAKSLYRRIERILVTLRAALGGDVSPSTVRHPARPSREARPRLSVSSSLQAG
jgi:RNA polymerase sigma factor (sigma-70 family)